MKTLDDVITELKTIYDRYEAEGCFYCSFQRECTGGYCYLADALHYLKELRDMTDIPMEYFESGGTLENFADTSQITCPKCHSEFVILTEENNPLTWDELKQMVGKPVWLEDSNQQGEWVLLSGMEDDVLYFVYRTCNEYKIYRKEHGTLWKAYRKEQS